MIVWTQEFCKLVVGIIYNENKLAEGKYYKNIQYKVIQLQN